MRTVHGNFKFEGMRKEQDFIIYPCSTTDETILLQSDKRLARVEIATGKAILSQGGRNYSTDLYLERGAKVILIDQENMDKIIKMRNLMAGVNPDPQAVLIGSSVERFQIENT